MLKTLNVVLRAILDFLEIAICVDLCRFFLPSVMSKYTFYRVLSGKLLDLSETAILSDFIRFSFSVFSRSASNQRYVKLMRPPHNPI